LPNGNLVIKTEKHDIVAMWTDGALYYPLSVDGTKIDTPSETPDNNTLVFAGELPNNLKEIISNISPLSEYIEYINMVESRRWNIHTKNGITIYLPENNIPVAVNKISVLNQTHKLLSRELDVIDMRDSARILVKTRK
jgi:cell division septal protein FtsQ